MSVLGALLCLKTLGHFYQITGYCQCNRLKKKRSWRERTKAPGLDQSGSFVFTNDICTDRGSYITVLQGIKRNKEKRFHSTEVNYSSERYFAGRFSHSINNTKHLKK